jgi:hypothetical protein
MDTASHVQSGDSRWRQRFGVVQAGGGSTIRTRYTPWREILYRLDSPIDKRLGKITTDWLV